MRLLALDSAGGASTVALCQDGDVLARAARRGGHHSEQLLALVEECLAAAGLALAQVDAMACGRGPGAFTGVRLAVAVAQGLAFASGRRVIPVSNLQAAAERAARLEGAPQRLLVCHDARMQEVYWACYELGAEGTRLIGEEAVSAPAAVALPGAWTDSGRVWGVGTAFAVHAPALAPLAGRLECCHGLEGEAEDIARIAARLGMGYALVPEELAPVYLREQVVDVTRG